MMKRQGEDNSQSDKDCQPCGKAAATGRTGMDLWQILVLGVTALAPGVRLIVGWSLVR